MSRIYAASSWRNSRYSAVVSLLRDHGHDVYDFTNPPNGTGFNWSEVLPGWDHDYGKTDTDTYLRGLKHPRSEQGFASDFDAMQACDTCVLVLPCGNSAHLELGWFIGQQRPTAILLDGPEVRPDLMYKLAGYVAPTTRKLLDWLKTL